MQLEVGFGLAIIELIIKVWKLLLGKNLITNEEITDICKTWSNEGEIYNDQPFFTTLKFNNHDGDISGVLYRNDEEKLFFDLFLEASIWPKTYMVLVATPVGWRSIPQLKYKMKLAGNNNRISLNIKDINFQNEFKWPKELLMHIYNDKGEFEKSLKADTEYGKLR